MNKPKEIDFPKLRLNKSLVQKIFNNPIPKTVNATKKVCTSIICLLIKVNCESSCFQLKYFGKKP